MLTECTPLVLSPEFSVAPKSRKATVTKTPGADARSAIGELSPGCRVVGVSKGRFSLIDLIDAVLEQVGVASVAVATWTPGIGEMERVLALLETGRISAFHLLVDRSFPTRHPEYVERVTAICGADSIRMTRTHAKFALIRNEDYQITIRTSMNFNVNPRLEQFDLDDDSDIYALFAGLVDELTLTVPPGLTAPTGTVERGFYSLMERAAVVTAERNGLTVPSTADDVLQRLGSAGIA